MSEMFNVKLVVPKDHLPIALTRAEDFAKQWPDRIGSHNSVIYAGPGFVPMVVYRTHGGQIVVRATDCGD